MAAKKERPGKILFYSNFFSASVGPEIHVGYEFQFGPISHIFSPQSNFWWFHQWWLSLHCGIIFDTDPDPGVPDPDP
jgi:hypothetical protein